MSIPEAIFPEFCRRIGASGTGERMKLINTFAEDFPEASVRQVTIRLGEITTREMPKCVVPPEKKGGRAFMFYLRPCFYKYLPEDERPDDWERYAEEDEQRWLEEQDETKASPKASSDNASDTNFSTANGISPSVAEDDEDETEDEGEPVSKKLKVE